MDYGSIKITQHALRVSVFKVWKLNTIIIEEEEDYGNIKITQHALRVSVFKVLKLDTIIMEEEEEDGNYIRCIKPVFFMQNIAPYIS